MVIFERCERKKKKKKEGLPARRWRSGAWLLGAQVVAPRRPLGGVKRGILSPLPHCPPNLFLFFLSHLSSPHMDSINLSSILTQIYHPIHLFLLIIITLMWVFHLELSLSSFSERKWWWEETHYSLRVSLSSSTL